MCVRIFCAYYQSRIIFKKQSMIYRIYIGMCVPNSWEYRPSWPSLSKTFVTLFLPSPVREWYYFYVCYSNVRFLGVIVCNAGHNESFHFTIMQAEAVSLTRWRGGHVGINAYCDDTYMYTGVHSMRTVCLIELETNFEPIKVGEVVDDICMPYLRYVRDMEIWPIVVTSRADLITSGNGSLANWSNFCYYMEQLRLRPFSCFAL